MLHAWQRGEEREWKCWELRRSFTGQCMVSSDVVSKILARLHFLSGGKSLAP